jgi:hypothetical protein
MAPWSGQGKDFGRDHLNSGNGLQGMGGEHLGSLQGAASLPPCGGCATAPVYLRQKGGKSGWWKLWDTKV